jgi:hypothetical protein
MLGGPSPFNVSSMSTRLEAKKWLSRLVEVASNVCPSVASERGPALVQRLQPVFDKVDQYAERLGDLSTIFDREFAFVSAVSVVELPEIERLARLARSMLYLNSDDAKLASLALIRFGDEVEGRALPFRDTTPQRDEGLAARLILLSDLIRGKRLEFSTK